MQIEPIGVVALVLGCVGWFIGPAFSICVFVVSTALGAAGAIILTKFGSANIQPAHLLLGFLALGSVRKPGSLGLAAPALAFPRTGFWLLLTAVYATISAILLPRLFSGATYVFAVARSEIGVGHTLIPLAPSASNVTQTVYFWGDVACFLLFYIYGSKPELFVATVRAVLAVAALNIVFVGLDVVTYWTHTDNLLSFVRNANYRMLGDVSVLGYKRIVGSFPEASAFAYFTLGLCAFCTKLWLANVHARVTGPLALLSLAAIVFSTSSTGYVGACGLLAALSLTSIAGILRRSVSQKTFGFVVFAPLLMAALLVGARLNQPAWREIQRMVDATVLHKLSTQSGEERSRWNAQALTNFEDTDGLGGGVGSLRASSLPVAVLGQTGVIGAVTYVCFFLGTLFGRRDQWSEPYPAACQSAARWACFTQLLAASVAASFIDLDLPFYLFAGLACAGPALRQQRRTAPLTRRPVAAASL
jgi:hypothetical protein